MYSEDFGKRYSHTMHGMRKRYIISRNSETIATITAEAYSDAADFFVSITYGNGVTHKRISGDAGKSGSFQAYITVDCIEVPHGEPFHIVESEDRRYLDTYY